MKDARDRPGDVRNYCEYGSDMGEAPLLRWERTLCGSILNRFRGLKRRCWRALGGIHVFIMISMMKVMEDTVEHL